MSNEIKSSGVEGAPLLGKIAIYQETKLSAMVHVGSIYRIEPHWDGLGDSDVIRLMMHRFADGYNAYDPSRESAVKGLYDAVNAMVCRRCENRVGFTGEVARTYPNWQHCLLCSRIRAAIAAYEALTLTKGE